MAVSVLRMVKMANMGDNRGMKNRIAFLAAFAGLAAMAELIVSRVLFFVALSTFGPLLLALPATLLLYFNERRNGARPRGQVARNCLALYCALAFARAVEMQAFSLFPDRGAAVASIAGLIGAAVPGVAFVIYVSRVAATDRSRRARAVAWAGGAAFFESLFNLWRCELVPRFLHQSASVFHFGLTAFTFGEATYWAGGGALLAAAGAFFALGLERVARGAKRATPESTG